MPARAASQHDVTISFALCCGTAALGRLGDQWSGLLAIRTRGQQLLCTLGVLAGDHAALTVNVNSHMSFRHGGASLSRNGLEPWS